MTAEPKKLTATLRTVTPQIPNVVTLRLDLPLRFKPSQAIALTLPGDPKKRFFSISSAPSEGSFIEITVKSEPGTPFAAALQALKRGDTLEVEGPVGGSLAVPEPVTSPLVFIGAGTGVAPFRSIIRSLLDGGIAQPIYLLHSVQRKAELLFMKDFQTWSGKKKNFHYVPTITQDFDEDWKNETGRIQDTLLFKHLPDTPNHYYLCGPTSFVDDMEKILLEQLKVATERIRREKW